MSFKQFRANPKENVKLQFPFGQLFEHRKTSKRTKWKGLFK